MSPRLNVVKRDSEDRVVRDAIAFIDKKAAQHARGLALEIGEYLWVHVWHRDIRKLTSQNRSKVRSMRKIASSTGYSYDELRTRVVAALTREKLEKMGLDLPNFDLTDFAELYELRAHPRAAKALAMLAHETDLSVDELRRHITRWRRHLDEGGKLVDLKRDPHGKKKEKKKKNGEKRPPRSNDELRVVRVLAIVHRWVKIAKLGTRQKQAIRARLGVLRTHLQAGAS